MISFLTLILLKKASLQLSWTESEEYFSTDSPHPFILWERWGWGGVSFPIQKFILHLFLYIEDIFDVRKHRWVTKNLQKIFILSFDRADINKDYEDSDVDDDNNDWDDDDDYGDDNNDAEMFLLFAWVWRLPMIKSCLKAPILLLLLPPRWGWGWYWWH